MSAEEINEDDEIQVISLEDEKGENHDFEIIDMITDNGTEYYALLPYYENPEELDDKAEEDDVTEVVIMRLSKSGDEEILESIEDEEEYNRIADIFDERLGTESEDVSAE